MEDPKHHPIGKVHKNMHNMDLNEVNSRTSYNKYHKEKSDSRSQQNDQNDQELNDNNSEKANSVHTSYQYRKNKNGPNSTYSKGSSNHNNQNEDQISVSISDNDNLICANCINSVLIEEKQKRDDIDKNYYNSDGFFDGNRNYEKNLIEERKKQREYNTNEAIQNLAKINAGLSNKEKLIRMNENSRNPLNDGLPDYQYKKFQEDYQRRQKMINDNINKFYPKSANERPEITSYYDNYVNNPNYNKDINNNNKNYNNNYNNNMKGEFDPRDKNRQEYLKSLEEQINQKNEMKRKEKEEDQRREQQQY